MIIKKVSIRKKTLLLHFKNLKTIFSKTFNRTMKKVLKVPIFCNKYLTILLIFGVRTIFNLHNLIILMDKFQKKATKYVFQNKNSVDLENLSLLISKSLT